MHQAPPSSTLLLALALPIAPQADTVRPFDLSATFQSAAYAPYTIDFGTLGIDTTTGLRPLALLLRRYAAFNIGGDSYGYTSELSVAMRLTFSNGFHTNKYPFDIILPVLSLVDDVGGPICSDTNPAKRSLPCQILVVTTPFYSHAGFGSACATTGN